MRTNVRQMVAVLAAVGLSVPAAALAAERDTAGSKTQGTGAGATAESGGAKAPDKKLVEGLQKLHAGNQAEVQDGQLAQQAASNPEVKAFGEKLVTDHGQNDQQLVSLAQTMGVSLEGKPYTDAQKDAQKRMSKLQSKTGPAFDKAFVQAMVKDHEKDTKDVKKLSKQARKDGQTEAATFLDQTEQAMQGHLATAKQLEKTVKNEKNTASSKNGSSSSSTGSSAAPK
jgi:putative membrane protein